MHKDLGGQLFVRGVVRRSRVVEVGAEDDCRVRGKIPVQEAVRIENLESATIDTPVTHALARESVQQGPGVLARVDADGEDVLPLLSIRGLCAVEVIAESRDVPPVLGLTDQRGEDFPRSGRKKRALTVLVEGTELDVADLDELPSIRRQGELVDRAPVKEISALAEVEEPTTRRLEVLPCFQVEKFHSDFPQRVKQVEPLGINVVIQTKSGHIIKRNGQFPIHRERERSPQ